MKVSIIIPSRLQVNPYAPAGSLWLDRALAAVRRQEVRSGVELEVIVGLDPGAAPPPRISDVRWVNAASPGQAHAVNAAVAASNGDVLAFLEDDDAWHPRRLAYGLRCQADHDLVTSNQREVMADGTFVRTNDFATPSGWLLRRATWERLGPLDEAVRFHVDTEYLGRANAAGLRRLHLVEAGAALRPWLKNVARFSRILSTQELEPLVVRTVNPGGGMSQISTDPAARAQSEEEHRRMLERFGTIPW